MDLTSITPDAAGLRALAHPARLRMLGLLRSDGPATATSLAATMGLNTGATSYHLRQLAKHGFVEEDAERGNARDRWWRAATQGTSTDPADMRSPGERDAYHGYQQAIAVVHTERLQRAVEEVRALPQDWRAATRFSDWGLRLTPARARQLVEAMAAVVAGWEEDLDAEDGEDFEVILHAFPRPGRVAEPGR